MLSTLSAHPIRWLLFVVWLGVFLSQSEPLVLALNYGGFTFLGILGAIFANSTGAGGGVVFMPFFNQLGFSVATSVATSFAIQCFGMTAGAITWWVYYRNLGLTKATEVQEWQALPKLTYICVPFSLLGVWSVQILPQFFAYFSDPQSLHTGFGVFSICLAISIFATVLLLKNKPIKLQLNSVDYCALILISYVGGGITAWLSIGVGELLAVYLIIRGFNVTLAIAAAVILSAFTVWGGILFHLIETRAVYWPVVLFAGIGAAIGGILAKHLVMYFSARNLKLFFAGWVFLLGISSLPF
ncbi:sulfite exporter TauE/SafE family protein [Paraglaciecola aquimarina]|uniref:Probable membrane transporter protein n=1 Tax=Paraglaciecola algarum TaxID=3050085 RepID=A0ABS9DDB1_9ALTE|nr:sulfite exporter TauE/SafE family protein [Paraglaciecola sp. G1-23]MCF2949764.1 sulfite exporter TauE/SafE family protein [Paraglaciecola sp. G1-23]